MKYEFPLSEAGVGLPPELWTYDPSRFVARAGETLGASGAVRQIFPRVKRVGCRSRCAPWIERSFTEEFEGNVRGL